MTSSFNRNHWTMLVRYSGISFISGAVNHGFFSGARSFWTAVAGVVLFAVAFWMDRSAVRDRQSGSHGAWNTLFWSALLSVGLGFFTGGLQHFPDSPERSAWVTPLGFMLSALAFAAIEAPGWTRRLVAGSLFASLMVGLASLGTLQLLRSNPEWLGDHAHGTQAEAERALPASAIVARRVDRSITVAMGDDLRFVPGSLKVSAGETVRLVVTNRGHLGHELVLGSAAELKEHAQQMRQGPAVQAHGSGNQITLAPGASGELVATFHQAGTFEFACLVPGHYEAGMRGSIVVAAASVDTTGPAGPAGATPRPASRAPKGHNDDHKH